MLPQLVAAAARGAAVLEAPPGAGKTTRVPPALDDIVGRPPGQIWVVEPRRLAARLSARRVAAERGEKPGASVGYRVRFDDVVGPDTRVVFVTEGVLLRRLQQDPSLRGIATVVFDEFHERHLQADVALALCRRLQRERALSLVVMSATLEVGPIAEFLGGSDGPATTVRSEGRRFEVAVDYLEPDLGRTPPRLENLVATAVKRLFREGLDGDVLVFLPGAAEIRRAARLLSSLELDFELAVLHGDLSAEEQDRAIRPGPRRKVVLSTNVAETSVTVEGVVAVIDSGLARVARYSPWSGLQTLSVQRVSRASATQRAGRAGRLRPGRCLRLYSRHDHDGRPLHDAPEVERADLAESVLLLASTGVVSPVEFPWFEAPPSSSLDAAQSLLRRLGALDGGGAITDTGRELLAIPAHPRLARVLVEGQRRGIGAEAALAVAVLSEGPIRQAQPATHDGPSDLDEEMEAVAEARRLRFDGERLRGLHIDAGSASAADRVRKELARAGKAGPVSDEDAALGLALLAGFPDRVARRRHAGGDELVLSSGGTAKLAPSSVVKSAELMVLLDAEWRSGPALQRGGVIGRLAVAVEPEWLLEAGGLDEKIDVEWNRAAGRAEVVSRYCWGELTLEESRRSPSSDEERQRASMLLGQEIRGRFTQPDEATLRLGGRLAFAQAARPSLQWPSIDLDAALAVICANRSSLDELPPGGLGEALRSALGREQLQLLDQLAPTEISLKHGRKVRVDYLLGQPPFAASRLQDFFGMLEGPRIGGVPLTLHLLAPNQRPVQVTNDLAGFWDRHYPSLRRELGRKYPRHAWPEDPRTAVPDVPRRR